MKKVAEFIFYNNAVPIFFGVLFLGAAGAAAATPEVRDAMVGAEQVVQSVDNSYIVNVDIGNYPFAVVITDVNEDEEFYYVTYTLQTIDLVDAVWQDVNEVRELVVSKAALDGKDLGLYATKQIAEVRDFEKKRLAETQEYERKIGASQKTVATVYSGLIGQFLDPTQDTLPNYEPVVKEPEPIASNTSGGQVLGASTEGDTVPPAISIIGDSVVRHPKGEAYVDLGAVVTDNVDEDITYDIYLDGHLVEKVVIDTNKLWAYVIEYKATDAAGNTSEAKREVVVEELPASSTPTTPTPEEESVPTEEVDTPEEETAEEETPEQEESAEENTEPNEEPNEPETEEIVSEPEEGSVETPAEDPVEEEQPTESEEEPPTE